MPKQKLMIPFTYYNEEMIEYTDFSYEEGKVNSYKILWDTIKNKKANEPWKKMYRDNLDDYNKLMQEWNDNIHNGIYVKVDEIIWKENFEFDDTLYVDSMSRGRSAANFTLISRNNNKKYNMFMTDIVDMIQNANVMKGEINGVWTFCKRGKNFGVKLVKQK